MNFIRPLTAPHPLLSLLFLPFLIFILPACEEDDDDDNNNNNPGPVVYFVADVKYNNTAIQQYVCNEFMFKAKVDTTGNDTLFFEGERTVDASYMYFNLITDDLYDFQNGDSIVIPYDAASGTEVFCSLLINSCSPSIFQPGAGVDQGMVYIDSIDYANKFMKGRFHGTFYSFPDSLKVTNGRFLLDE